MLGICSANLKNGFRACRVHLHLGGHQLEVLTVAPQVGPLGFLLGGIREKQTKTTSYWRPPRASPTGQAMPNKAHIGLKATPAEYVEAGRWIVKQRKYIAKNPNVTRRRHFKMYPGENVKVLRNTSLQAMVSGRLKLTHDVTRDVLIANVLPEPRSELLRDDLWRYRTEHIADMEENKYLIYLRQKALPHFGREDGWPNQPLGVRPMSKRFAKPSDKNPGDRWNNPSVRDPMILEPYPYPLSGNLLKRHIEKVRRRQQGLPDEDPEFEVYDTRAEEMAGQSAQR